MYSKSELLVLRLISRGCTNMESIMAASGLSTTGLYAVLRAMRRDGLLSEGRGFDICRTPYHVRLTNLVESSPNAVELLSDSGMRLLGALREPKTVDQLMEETGLSRASVHRRIKTARSVGAVTVADDGRYVLNDILWPGLRELFDCKDDMDRVMDPLVPTGARILHRGQGRVLYSSPRDYDDQPTGLTYFERNGFPGSSSVRFYSTQAEPVSENQAFEDAFRIAMADDDYRLRLMLMMYFMNRRGSLSLGAEASSLFTDLESGCGREGWPSWEDAESKAADLGLI